MTRKSVFIAWQKELAIKEQARKHIDEKKYNALPEKQQEEQYQITYLADIVMRAFLYNKCQETNHEVKVCEDCKSNLPLFMR